MHRKYGYFLAFILPLGVWVGFNTGGIFQFLAPFLVFVIIPIMDFTIGPKEIFLNTEKVKELDSQIFFKVLLMVWVLVQTVFFFWTFQAYIQIHVWWEKIGFVLSVGLVTGGVGITIAHELGHKKSSWERALSKWLLMQVGYMHFYIEHNKGHHVWVATEKDPATASKSESFYRFWFKSVFGGYKHAMELEKMRLLKKGFPFFNISNQMIWYAIIPIVFVFAIMAIISYFGYGWQWDLLIFYTGQSLVGFTLLELVNYVEHYGLSRRILPNGRYEPVGEYHSWNSDFTVSNLFLFQLQLHTDHHMHAIKRYQTLVSHRQSPQLPGGYPTMILLAMVPFLWFKVIDPILEKWENKTS